jgi:hypothetical protein
MHSLDWLKHSVGKGCNFFLNKNLKNVMVVLKNSSGKRFFESIFKK